MFSPISIDEFVEKHIRSNPDENAAGLRDALKETVKLKAEGCKCYQCGRPIWAVGSAIVGEDKCFTCITGENDSGGNPEIDEVCF